MKPRAWSPWVAFGVAAALAVAGCGPDTTPAPADQNADIDALRALPYLGFSAAKAKDGEKGVVHYDAARSYPGYNLFTSRTLCRADLVDMEGRQIRTWRPPTCLNWGNAQLLADGDLIVPGMEKPSGEPSFEQYAKVAHLFRFSFAGRLKQKINVTAHHDVEITPDGNIATLTAGLRLISEVDPEIPVRDHSITVLAPDGTLIDQASIYDILKANPAAFSFQAVKPAEEFGQQSIDLLHANSVEFMRHPELAARDPLYALDNVLISMRHQDTVAVIDFRAKKLLWAWGQGEVAGQHDATVLADGHFLIFDNGLGRGWSRVIELDPLTKTVVWEYRAPRREDFYTHSRGANQRLPNGNTLATNSENGHAFEITPGGQVVWEFYTPHTDKEGHRATIVRMHRYEKNFIDGLLAAQAAAAGPR